MHGTHPVAVHTDVCCTVITHFLWLHTSQTSHHSGTVHSRLIIATFGLIYTHNVTFFVIATSVSLYVHHDVLLNCTG